MDGAWRHQAITRTNADWSSVKSSDIHIRAISQEMPQPSITKIHLKIISKILFQFPRGQWVKKIKSPIQINKTQQLNDNQLTHSSKAILDDIKDNVDHTLPMLHHSDCITLWQIIHSSVRLLHSPGLVAIGPSVGYETWPPIGWHHPFVICLSKYRLGLPSAPMHYGLTCPVGIPTVFQTPVTFPLHCPYSRQ